MPALSLMLWGQGCADLEDSLSPYSCSEQPRSRQGVEEQGPLCRSLFSEHLQPVCSAPGTVLGTVGVGNEDDYEQDKWTSLFLSLLLLITPTLNLGLLLHSVHPAAPGSTLPSYLSCFLSESSTSPDCLYLGPLGPSVFLWSPSCLWKLYTDWCLLQRALPGCVVLPLLCTPVGPSSVGPAIRS